MWKSSCPFQCCFYQNSKWLVNFSCFTNAYIAVLFILTPIFHSFNTTSPSTHREKFHCRYITTNSSFLLHWLQRVKKKYFEFSDPSGPLSGVVSCFVFKRFSLFMLSRRTNGHQGWKISIFSAGTWPGGSKITQIMLKETCLSYYGNGTSD